MPTTATTTPAPLLRMAHIRKAFGGVPALSDAHLEVAPGEIHALIGENGAGKSTLIKILTGALRKDSGTVAFDGQPVAFASPRHAQDGGIGAIYQEVNLLPLRSVAENIFLGREPKRFGLIDWRQMNRQAADALAKLGIALDVSQPLGTLNIALQQMVAVARAVSRQSRLLVMDEPTSSLDEGEVQTLFGVLRGLRDKGVSVIYISHKLDELFALGDRITVMRDGQTIGTHPVKDMTKLRLVGLMLGRDPQTLAAQGQTAFGRSDRRAGDTLLVARHLRRGRALQDAGVTVRAGEIVGLAGLLGSGRTEVARALYGADTLDGGTVSFRGKDGAFTGPAQAIAAGIGYCSEDRKSEGIIPHLSVRENLTLALLPALAVRGIVSRARQSAVVDDYIKRLGIKASSPDQPLRELSGGNQQKVLLARSLCLQPKLLILDEPTRGIDVGAKAEIQRLINTLAGDGMGVLMISSELDEITEGSDRVVVMRDGRSVADLPRADATQPALLTAMAQGAAPAPMPNDSKEAPAPMPADSTEANTHATFDTAEAPAPDTADSTEAADGP